MSFRSLPHYFIHLTHADLDPESEPEAQAQAQAHSWESNMLRAGDERRLQAIGQRIRTWTCRPIC